MKVKGIEMLIDVVEGKVDVEMPEKVREVLGIINDLSSEFEDSVVDLRMSTYEDVEGPFPMYFCWETDKVVRSSTVEYIAYDEEKGDYFDWLQAEIGRDVRYDCRRLVGYFCDRFFGK